MDDARVLSIRAHSDNIGTSWVEGNSQNATFQERIQLPDDAATGDVEHDKLRLGTDATHAQKCVR